MDTYKVENRTLKRLEDQAKRTDCSGCPECALHLSDDEKYYSIPDCQSDTCLNCPKGYAFFAYVYGTCDVTGKICFRECTDNCEYFYQEGGN